MRCLKTSIVFFLIALPLIGIRAQYDEDWLDREIQTKQRLLQDRRALAKLAASTNAADYDIGYYGLDLHVNIDSQTIAGSVTIRGKSRIDSLNLVELDLASGLNVHAVTGQAVSYQHGNNILQIRLPEALSTGEGFEFTIDYSGSPLTGGFQGFSFGSYNGSPIVSTLSQPYYAYGWFPCKDRPNDKADSVDITLTVPANLEAVANGTLKKVENNSDGTRTYFWQERYPIATYLISLAVSEYTSWQDTYVSQDSSLTMPVMYWIYKDMPSPYTTDLALTPSMISFFSSIWGEYPFIKEKYGQAQFSWGGGMEHQTCASMGSFNEMLICHELAHQWWGDMVTCANWKNIWLNEGFARYAEALWREHIDGKTGLEAYMQILNRPQSWQNSSVYITDTTRVSAIFNRIVYDKGAWILHMLRKIAGKENFRAIFLAYRERHSMGAADTEDFQRVCEEVSGLDLDYFFSEWVYGLGQPHYQVSWHRVPASDEHWTVSVRIQQIQTTATYFSMPIELYLQTETGDTIITVWNSRRLQDHEFQINSKPLELIIDPDNYILKSVAYSTVDPDLVTNPTEFELSGAYPNPFNGSTHFRLYLPHDILGQLRVYNLAGQQVALIGDGRFRSGYRTYQWSPTTQASGIYFIRLESDDQFLERKVLYLK